MARYLFQFSYTPEAWAALTANPVDRRPGIQALAEKIGGRLVEFSYAFGEYDGIAIFEAPDETAMTAAILAAIGPGHLKATKTTVLITVEQALEALRTAGGLSYQAPSAQG